VNTGGYWSSENSSGDYSRIGPQLAQWSLGGLFEYGLHTTYLAQLDRATAALAAFYVQKFGWSAATARPLARDALTQAVSNGMGFYMYEPYPPQETELRRAILSRQPMERVRELDVDADSAAHMLDLAVTYPQALEYLLRKGANPDWANGFGKTALMYAAQHNQVESARVLLRHGASPNAATFIPTDSCQYNIETSGMTALHYAVRYASAALVDVLVDAGADVSREAVNWTTVPSTPLDWLRKYTGGTGETNSRLSAIDVQRLTRRLLPPSTAERERTAQRLVAQAGRDYRAGRFRAAIVGLDAALSAKPDDAAALELLQLAALRTGEPGRALQASSRLLPQLKDTTALANVRFNQGLACQGQGYGNETYCLTGALPYFLESWKLGHTPARQRQIDQTMASARPSLSCTVNAGSGKPWHLVAAWGKDFAGSDDVTLWRWRFYVRHGTDETIAASDISWATGSSPTGRRSPVLVERLDLGDFAVTVMEAGDAVSDDLRVRGQRCLIWR
jgi:hypothetical protein